MQKMVIFVVFSMFICLNSFAVEVMHSARVSSMTGFATVDIIEPIEMIEKQEVKFSSKRLAMTSQDISKHSVEGKVYFNVPRGQMVNISIPETYIFDTNHSIKYLPNIAKEGQMMAFNHKDGNNILDIGGSLEIKDEIPSANLRGVYILQSSY